MASLKRNIKMAKAVGNSYLPKTSAMGKCFGRCLRPGSVMQSKLNYLRPRAGSNLARELINGFKGHPHKVMLVDGQQRDGDEYTGQDLWLATGRLATGLMSPQHVKLETGESVLFMCNHCVGEKLLLIATLYTGATVMGAPLNSSLQHLRHLCQLTKPQVIMTNRNRLELVMMLRRAVEGMDRARIIIVDNDDEDSEQSIFSGRDLFEWPELDEELILSRVNRAINSKLHNSFIMTTSGSTGPSKLVPWTHERMLRDIWSMISATRANILTGSRLLPIDEDTVLAGNSTLEQGAGLVAMLWSFIVGAKFVLVNPNDEQQFWEQVDRHRITANIGNSHDTYKLLKKLVLWLDLPPREHVDISSMKYMAFGGSRMNIGPLMEILRPQYPNLQVTQFYGSTEAGFIALLSVEDAKKTLEPVGCLFPGVKAKIVDPETGEILSSMEEGELLIKSASLFDHYVTQPEAFTTISQTVATTEASKAVTTKQVVTEKPNQDKFDKSGFFKTGDLVHCDSEQRLYVHSRLSEVLFLDAQGTWTKPTDVENVVNKHPMVETSVVLGVPVARDAARTGSEIMKPVAFAKLKPVHELNKIQRPFEQKVKNLIRRIGSGRLGQISQDIVEFCSNKLDKSQQFATYHDVIILEEFPLVNGKIDRKQLMAVYCHLA